MSSTYIAVLLAFTIMTTIIGSLIFAIYRFWKNGLFALFGLLFLLSLNVQFRLYIGDYLNDPTKRTSEKVQETQRDEPNKVQQERGLNHSKTLPE